MMKNVKLLLAVALSVGAWCSANAQGYVQDSSGSPVRSGFDNCVRGGAVGQDRSAAGCDVSNNKRAAPVAATVTEPVVQTRPAPTAASEKPLHKNKKAKKKAKKVKKAAAN